MIACLTVMSVIYSVSDTSVCFWVDFWFKEWPDFVNTFNNDCFINWLVWQIRLFQWILQRFQKILKCVKRPLCFDYSRFWQLRSHDWVGGRFEILWVSKICPETLLDYWRSIVRAAQKFMTLFRYLLFIIACSWFFISSLHLHRYWLGLHQISVYLHVPDSTRCLRDFIVRFNRYLTCFAKNIFFGFLWLINCLVLRVSWFCFAVKPVLKSKKFTLMIDFLIRWVHMRSTYRFVCKAS